MIDPLTGLPNRQGIVEIVEHELRLRITSPGPLALVLLDLNDFRTINYEVGHLGGDELLRQLGLRFAGILRPRHFIGRYGGDLFLVVAPDTDSQEATVLGEEIRTAVERASYPFDGSAYHLTIRLGIAVAEVGEHPSFGDLLEHAYAAMDEEGRRQRGA